MREINFYIKLKKNIIKIEFLFYMKMDLKCVLFTKFYIFTKIGNLSRIFFSFLSLKVEFFFCIFIFLEKKFYLIKIISIRSRKLNSQLERAIQEAMTELDRSTSVTPTTLNATTTTTTTSTTTTTICNRPIKSRNGGQNKNQLRTKPIKIAPAPPNQQKCLKNIK